VFSSVTPWAPDRNRRPTERYSLSPASDYSRRHPEVPSRLRGRVTAG